MKNGMLPVTLPLEQCKRLYALATEGEELEVDLEKQEVRTPDGSAISFAIESFPRYCLLNGLDDIGLTLKKVDLISAFEIQRSRHWPWLDGLGYQPKVQAHSVQSNLKMEW
jgi:3-isopropylmalate dehydratase